MTSPPFGLSVNIIIRNEHGNILILKRSMKCKTNAGKWDLPGGKIGTWENFDEALYREVEEETGLNISINRVVGVTESNLSSVHVVFLIMEGELISGEVELSNEHDEFQWVKQKELMHMDLCDHFRDILSNLH